ADRGHPPVELRGDLWAPVGRDAGRQRQFDVRHIGLPSTCICHSNATLVPQPCHSACLPLAYQRYAPAVDGSLIHVQGLRPTPEIFSAVPAEIRSPPPSSARCSSR